MDASLASTVSPDAPLLAQAVLTGQLLVHGLPVPPAHVLAEGLAIADEAAVIDLRSYGLPVYDAGPEVYVAPLSLIDRSVRWLLERGLAERCDDGRRLRLTSAGVVLGRPFNPRAG